MMDRRNSRLMLIGLYPKAFGIDNGQHIIRISFINLIGLLFNRVQLLQCQLIMIF